MSRVMIVALILGLPCHSGHHCETQNISANRSNVVTSGGKNSFPVGRSFASLLLQFVLHGHFTIVHTGFISKFKLLLTGHIFFFTTTNNLEHENNTRTPWIASLGCDYYFLSNHFLANRWLSSQMLSYSLMQKYQMN